MRVAWNRLLNNPAPPVPPTQYHRMVCDQVDAVSNGFAQADGALYFAAFPVGANLNDMNNEISVHMGGPHPLKHIRVRDYIADFPWTFINPATYVGLVHTPLNPLNRWSSFRLDPAVAGNFQAGGCGHRGERCHHSSFRSLAR